MESNHPGVKSIYQRNGAIHNSIVVGGAYKGNAAFVAVRGNSRKVHNLRRNPRCSVLSVKPDWRSFVMERLEQEGTLVAAVHMPAPGFGKIVRLEGRRYWQAL